MGSPYIIVATGPGADQEAEEKLKMQKQNPTTQFLLFFGGLLTGSIGVWSLSPGEGIDQYGRQVIS